MTVNDLIRIRDGLKPFADRADLDPPQRDELPPTGLDYLRAKQSFDLINKIMKETEV